LKYLKILYRQAPRPHTLHNIPIIGIKVPKSNHTTIHPQT